jgi:hypothetical protein
MKVKEIVAEAGMAGALIKGAKALGPEMEKLMRIPAEQFQRVSHSMQHIAQATSEVNYRNASSELGNVEMFLRQALAHNPEVDPALASEVKQVANHANNLQRILADVSAGKINAYELSTQDIKAAVSNFSDKFTQLVQKLQ